MSLRIVVCVKYVPDATGDRHFAEDLTVDRDDVDGLLSELDEYAVEQALQIADEARRRGDHRADRGPGGRQGRAAQGAVDGRRQGRPRRGRRPARHRRAGHLAGAGQGDREGRLRPGRLRHGLHGRHHGRAARRMLAERLGVPQVTLLSEVSVEDGTVTGRRDGDTASEQLEASLPAVVSVTDQSGEARYPSFKGIMAAKKKPVESWDLADLEIEADEVGLDGRLDRGRLRDRASGPHRGHDRQGRGRGRQAARRVPRGPEVHLSRGRFSTAPHSFASAGEQSHG